ncbi:uncharacterized protein JCM10292_003907, partial [Rhodotorula paludigena]|uniref:uncharacterized protein n=1 Tax=Rhodotorula paludigena TaxID=86838 RepID=UPI00316EB457
LLARGALQHPRRGGQGPLRRPPRPPRGRRGPPAATNSAGSSIIQAITATTRPRPTTFPSLFGSTSDGTQRAEWAELGILVASGVLGAWAVMRTL